MARLSTGEQEFLSDSSAGASVPVVTQDAAAAAEGSTDSDGIQVIDARGISAPLPLLRAHRALRAMQPGQLLKVVTSSKQALTEFQALAKYIVRYELLSQEESGDEIVHLLRRRR
jgi:tRNA 2-thiouridine synthesizing protein A